VLQCRVLRPDGQEVWRKDLLSLEVRPPFWRTLWFVLLMMGVLVALAYGIFRYQLEQIRTRERIRSRIASDLHDEVGSALGSILLGSELAMRHTPAGGEKALQLLGNIRGTTLETLESMADIIWSIHPKNDGGDKLSERMRQTLRELLEASDVEVIWEAPPGFESLTFSMDARRNLLRLFKEAIHNIAKHAQATQVRVAWEWEGKMLTLSIADNGRGFIPGNSNGHGLDSMNQRAEALRGKFSLDSAPGMGTRVLLSVPFKS
jgi:signal transduction histidine kinase